MSTVVIAFAVALCSIYLMWQVATRDLVDDEQEIAGEDANAERFL